MSQRQLLYFFLLLAIIVGGLHLTALKLDLYWIIPWFDKIVHFFGGFLVALAAYIIFYQIILKSGGKSGIFPTIFFVVLAVSLLWEVFEVVTGNTFVSQDKYVFDTVTDVIFDLIGAGGFYFFIKDKSIT